MKLIDELISTGAPEVTPDQLDRVIRMLPHLRAKFAALEDQRPDLNATIDFLSQVIEDFSAGLCRDLTYHAAADIAFALQYLYQDIDLIPDSLPEVGFADDAAVSNNVLNKHQRILRDYAERRGFRWEDLVTM